MTAGLEAVLGRVFEGPGALVQGRCSRFASAALATLNLAIRPTGNSPDSVSSETVGPRFVDLSERADRAEGL